MKFSLILLAGLFFFSANTFAKKSTLQCKSKIKKKCTSNSGCWWSPKNKKCKLKKTKIKKTKIKKVLNKKAKKNEELENTEYLDENSQDKDLDY